MKLSEVLRALRAEKGVNQTETAEFLTARGCAVTQRAVSKWELGDTQPSAEQLLLLCELYGVRDVLNVFRGAPDFMDGLNAEGRRRVREYVRLLKRDGEFSVSAVPDVEKICRTLPLYDLPVSAGTGQFLDSESYELIDADETTPLAATFAVRINGDSMTPRYVDRQIVYVKQQQTLSEGECGIFILNGSAYCKLLGDGGTLVSINKKYSPIKIGEFDEFRVLGKVVG